MRLSLGTRDVSHLVLLWVLFTATSPFLLHMAIPHHPYKWMVVAGLAVMIALMLKHEAIKLGNRVIVGILIIQMAYSLVAMFLHEFFFLGIDWLYLNLFFQLASVLIVYFYVSTFYSIHKIGISSIYVITSIGILGAIAFLLGLLGIIGPVSSFPHETPHYQNFILTFSNSVIVLPDFIIIRVAGFFDEPGAFAYYVTIALLLNKLYDYSRKLEIALVVLGIFTLSLAFFISIFMYFAIFYAKKIWKLTVFTVIVMSAMWYLNYAKQDSEIAANFYHLTIARFHPAPEDDTKIIAGDNRTQKFLWSKEAFLKSPLIGHGMSAYSNPNSEFHGKLCCNILDPLATHGMLGAPIFFLLFIYWTAVILLHKKLDLVSLGAWLIVFANFFQRPGMSGGLYGYFVFIFLVEASIWRLRRSIRNDERVSYLLSRNPVADKPALSAPH